MSKPQGFVTEEVGRWIATKPSVLRSNLVYLDEAYPIYAEWVRNKRGVVSPPMGFAKGLRANFPLCRSFQVRDKPHSRRRAYHLREGFFISPEPDALDDLL